MSREKNAKEPEGHGAREALLRAGAVLFAEKGYASTSVREIVEMAGVTKPVLYYYFRSKEGLFRAILDWAAEMQGAVLKEVLEMPGTVLERLLLLYRRLYRGVLENQSLFRMIHNLFFGPPQGSPPYDIEIYHRRMVEVVKCIYLQGVEKGEVRSEDPDAVADLVMGLIDSCFHRVFLRAEDSDLKRPEQLLRLAFDGLAAGTGG